MGFNALRFLGGFAIHIDCLKPPIVRALKRSSLYKAKEVVSPIDIMLRVTPGILKALLE